MKKKLPFIALASLLTIGLITGCGESSSGGDKPSGDTTGGNPTTSVVNEGKVTSVTIVYDGDSKVLAGSNIKLSADVAADEGVSTKVDWSSSDPGTVVNKGVVKFENVAVEKKVVITATSTADSTKSGSIEFTIVPSVIDFSKSRGDFDNSLYLEDGSIEVAVGDSALIYNNVHGTKWYVEATITCNEFNPNDAFPKFGFMTSTDGNGYWCADMGDGIPQTAFYFVDAANPSQNPGGWSNLAFVGLTEERSNWDWGNLLSQFTVPGAHKVPNGSEFKIGMMRSGIYYYFFVGGASDTSLTCYKRAKWTGIAADEDSYVWLGGWATGYTASNFVAASGSDADKYLQTPTLLTAVNTSETVYIGESFQIEPYTDVDFYDRGAVQFEVTSGAEIISVDSDGLVTAGQTAGTATVTMTLGSLSKDISVTVTDDAMFSVIIDGRNSDLLYTETVKANSLLIQQGPTSYTTMYGSRNSRGIYVYAEQYVKDIRNIGNEWWQRDNIEMIVAARKSDGTFDRWHEGVAIQRGFSVLNGGTSFGFTETALGDCLVETVVGENTLYHTTYEAFISYADLGAGIDEHTPIIFTAGANLAAGWKNAPGWDAEFGFGRSLLLTKIGFVDGYSEYEELCNGSHSYGDWKVGQAPTCEEDGYKVRSCHLCAHEDREVIAKGAHTYAKSDINVTKAATCTATGTGTVECTTCHNTLELVLPIDHNNHTDGFEGEALYCSHCGEHAQYKHVMNNRWAGWGDANAQFPLVTADTNDFTAEVKFHLAGKLVNPEETPESWQIAAISLNGSLVRMDAIGWADTLTPSYGSWVEEGGETFTDYVSVIDNCDVTFTAARTGTALAITWNITDCENNNKYVCAQSFTLPEGNETTIAMTAEHAVLGIMYAKVNGADILGNKLVYQSYSSNMWDATEHQFLEVGKFTGDFSVTLNYNVLMNRSNDNWGDNCWKGALPILRDAADWHARSVCRMDWYGWCDGAWNNVASVETGNAWGIPDNGDGLTVLQNMDIVCTITRTGGLVTYAYAIKSVLTGAEYTWSQQVRNIPSDTICVAFSGESANITVNSVVVA